MVRKRPSRKMDTPWTPRMVKTTGKKSNGAPTGASTPTMVKTPGKKSKGAPTGASTPSKGTPQHKSFLWYKSGKKGERTISTKSPWLAKPFMTGRYVVPGPDYHTCGFGDQLGTGAMTTKLTNKVYTEWAETCLSAGESEGLLPDSGWSPTRSLAVRTTKRSKLGGRPTFYYKAGDYHDGVRKYDLQFLSPEMPGQVDKDTVVKGMQDFARCAVKVARANDLSKHAVLAMMTREMDIGAIEFDTDTVLGILVFTNELATKAGLY